MSPDESILTRQPLNTFWTAVVLVVLLPFLPLLFELMGTHHLKTDSIYLFAAMYVLGLGLVSKYAAYFAFMLVAGCSACYLYGLSLYKGGEEYLFWMWLFILISAVGH